MRGAFGAIGLAALLTLLPATARAEDKSFETAGALYSVEPRRLLGNHELSLAMGVLPLDAFGKGLTVQGAYAYHFSPLFGWEVVGGTYSFMIGTGLEQELLDRFDARTLKTDAELQGMLHSNFLFKPLYGKIAVLNRTLLSGEVFFLAGPALGFFDDRSRPFGADVGVGFRLFLSPSFSARLDIRDYVFVPDFTHISQHLYLSLGVSLTFGTTGSKDSTRTAAGDDT